MYDDILSKELNFKALQENFINAPAFPHVIIDNIFNKDFFAQLSTELNEFYSAKKNEGVTSQTIVESNKWGSAGLNIPPTLKKTGDFLQSEEFRAFLSKLTGFENLHMTLDINNSGYNFFHAMNPNSYLGPHTDHTVDMGPNKNLYHVLNIIIYAQNQWDPNWGGGTTIFNPDVNLATDVEYKPNRALVFMHSPKSVHGTQRVSPHAKLNRLSLYFDYYSTQANPYAHIKEFAKLPLISSPHIFYLPKWSDYLKSKNKKYLKFHLSHYKNLVKYYVFGSKR